MAGVVDGNNKGGGEWKTQGGVASACRRNGSGERIPFLKAISSSLTTTTTTATTTAPGVGASGR